MRNGRPLAHVPVSSNHLQASLLLSLLGKSSPCLKVSWQVNQRHCVLTVSSKSTVCQLTLNRPWTSLLLLFCEYNIWFLKSQFFVLKMVTVSFLCGLNVTLRGNPGVDGITLKQCYWQVMNRHHFQSFKVGMDIAQVLSTAWAGKNRNPPFQSHATDIIFIPDWLYARRSEIWDQSVDHSLATLITSWWYP